MTERVRATKEINLFISGAPVTITETDGNTDNILVQRKPMHEKTPLYLAAVTRSIGEISPVTPNDILDLLVPDQEYLAIEVAKFTNDDEPIILRDTCDNCPSDSGPIEVDLAALDLRPLPAGAVGPPPLFELHLPKTDQDAVFAYLTGHQELRLLKNLINGQIDASRLMFERLRSLGGVEKPDLRLRHVIALPGRDRAILREAMDNTECGYDDRVSWRCDACGSLKIIRLLTHMGFFFPRAKAASGSTSSSARGTR